jgi:hypothetical protein
MNPSPEEVSDRLLDSCLADALSWLASELKYDIRTNEQIGLTAGQFEYPLPQDLSHVIWIEWNGKVLDPTSTYLVNATGGSWREQDANATLSEYAIQGRKLILLPPPSAAAITTDPYLSWRYIASGGEMGESGVPGLSDLDLQIARYQAACNWLTDHITAENLTVFQAKIAAYTEMIARLLPNAKRRNNSPDVTYFPSWRLDHGRDGAAR